MEIIRKTLSVKVNEWIKDKYLHARKHYYLTLDSVTEGCKGFKEEEHYRGMKMINKIEKKIVSTKDT